MMWCAVYTTVSGAPHYPARISCSPAPADTGSMTTTRLPTFTRQPAPDLSTSTLRTDRDPGQAWQVTRKIAFCQVEAYAAARAYRG